MPSIKRTIALLIYLSVIMGIILLVQLYVLVPQWLFYSVLLGWVAYVIAAALTATGRRIAYPLVFVLSILTLAVSLPQPEHQAFVEDGLSPASITFLFGSVLQLALIILIPAYFLRKKAITKPS